MIRLNQLTKRYGQFTAVDRHRSEVPSGELFGFLGPNGAGKTTTFRMIAGILRPTSGTVEIGGIDINRRPLEAKARLGFIPDRPFVYDKLTGGGVSPLRRRALRPAGCRRSNAVSTSCWSCSS